MAERIVRILARIDGVDPWLAGRSDNTRYSPGFFWHDGIGGMTLRAEGSIACAADDGWTGAARLRSIPTEHLPSLAPEQALPLPLAVGGAAFTAGAPAKQQRAWKRWPRSLWWIPERVVLRAPEGSAVVMVQRLARALATAADEAGLRRALDCYLADLRRHSEIAGISRSLRTIADPHKARFCRLVELALDAIGAGLLEKVVVARAREITLLGSPFDPLAQLLALRHACPDAVVFGLHRGGYGTWLGATPEVLARVNNGRIATSALAGTVCGAGNDAARALLGCDKIRREHAVVVKAMFEALAPLTADLLVADSVNGGSLTGPDMPRLLRAERLLHLQTPLAGTLAPGRDVLCAARALHPTPALAGHPRDAACDWLAAHEDLDRGYFGGPIGWVAPSGDGVIAVAIRSALVRPHHALAYGGAGIVSGSDPQSEWQETENKIAVVWQTLRIARAAVAANPELLP